MMERIRKEIKRENADKRQETKYVERKTEEEENKEGDEKRN